MVQPLLPGQPYAGHRPDRVLISCWFSTDAAELARHYGRGKRLGEFLSRLVTEHHARQEARQEARKEIAEELLARP